MNWKLLRFSAGVVVVALVAIAASLYVSTRYIEEQQRLSNTGDMEGAISSLDTAARLAPFSAQPLETKASLLRSQGNNREAEKVLRVAAERESSDYAIPQELGELRMDAFNKPSEAADSYRRALELNPKAGATVAGLAEARLSAGELKKAKTWYERLRESGEMTVDQRYDLGRIYVRTGEPEKGVQTLRKTKRVAEDGLENLGGQLRESQLGFLQSVDLAIADALVIERRYNEAYQIVANSSSEQAPTIMRLISSNPEGYRQTVVNSDVY